MSIESVRQVIREEIEKLNHVLRLLEDRAKKVAKGPRRKMSAAARKRISAAQRRRWAKVRAGKK
jgi:predicted lipoprotein